MKRIDAEAGGGASFRSAASRLASASAAAALLLLMGSGARADVIERFDLSGDINTFGASAPFTGTINLDFTNNFADDTVQSLQIAVQGRPVFTQGASVVLSASTTGTVQASNSAGDTLTMLFITPEPGVWTGFDTGRIVFADLVFGGLTGSFFGADGVITRVSGPAITGSSNPPSVPVPELSTWTMMLAGLAGLGLATKGRRALAFLGGRA